MNKELLDKIVSLYTEIDNVNEKIEAIKFAESVLLIDGIDFDIDVMTSAIEKYEANLADLQAELNIYEIVEIVPTTAFNPSDNKGLDWVNVGGYK